MKTILTLAIGLLLFSVQGVASDKTNALVIRGQILETVSIDYEISLMDVDDNCTVIKTGQALKFYRILLETGRKYKITFYKAGFSKSLIVEADARGIFPVDIDFAKRNNAELTYDYSRGKYHLKVLPIDYEQTLQSTR